MRLSIRLCRLFIFCCHSFFCIADEACEEGQYAIAVYHSTMKVAASSTEESQVISLATLEGEPSAVVHNCINAISGQYCEFQTDLISHGSDPIAVQRAYSGNADTYGNFCLGWSINCKEFLLPILKSEKVKPRESNDQVEKIYVKQTPGYGLTFGIKQRQEFTPEPKCLKGVCNTSHGVISGQATIKNFSVIKKGRADEYILRSGSGSEKVFRPNPHDKQDQYYYRMEEKKPNGNILQYLSVDPALSKKYNADFCPLHLKNSQHQGLHSIFSVRSEDPGVSATEKFFTQDGRYVIYKASPSMLGKYMLREIERSDAPNEKYEYEKVCNVFKDKRSESGKSVFLRDRLTKKTGPEGRYLKIEYYNYGHNEDIKGDINIKKENDPRIDRVKSIWGPAGKDSKPIKLYEFIYEIEGVEDPQSKNSKKAAGNFKQNITSVYDAYRHKKCYQYNADDQLTKITNFDEKNKLYAVEQFYWGKENSKDYTNLLSKTFSAALEMKFIIHYTYDEAGNLLNNSLYGNLSGSNLIPPSVNQEGVPVDNGCEKYCKKAKYSADGFNLLLEETDGIQKTVYTYYPRCNLVKSKLQGSPDRWMRRWFFFYNEDAAMTCEIVDDGSAEDEHNLQDVTERLITTYVPRKTYPVGLPDILEKKCLDLATGQEILIHKIVNHYTPQGWLASEEHYDQSGSLRYTLSREYDPKGNVIKEVDAE